MAYEWPGGGGGNMGGGNMGGGNMGGGGGGQQGPGPGNQWPPPNGEQQFQDARSRVEQEEARAEQARIEAARQAAAQRRAREAEARRQAAAEDAQAQQEQQGNQGQGGQAGAGMDPGVAREIAGQRAQQQRNAERPDQAGQQAGQAGQAGVDDRFNQQSFEEAGAGPNGVEADMDRAGERAAQEWQAGATHNPRRIPGNVRRRTYTEFKQPPDVPGRRLLYANLMRTSDNLDPILKYYMSKDKAPLSYEGPDNPQMNDFHFRHGNLDLNKPPTRAEAQSWESGENSLLVHWSQFGFGQANISQDENGNARQSGPVIPLPNLTLLPSAFGTNWNKAVQNEELTDNEVGPSPEMVRFSQHTSFLPISPGGEQSSGYNFPEQIIQLAESLLPERLPSDQEEPILRGVNVDDSAVERQWAVAGTNRSDFFQNWWESGTNGNTQPETAWDVQVTIDNRLLEENPDQANRAALAAYPTQNYTQLASARKLEFEYINFRAEAPYMVDYISARSQLLNPNLNRPEGVMPLGTIRSEFNTWQKDFVEAAAGVPEALLPNLYLYNLVSDASDTPGRNAWEGSEEAGESLQTRYDELMTMGDFESRLAPSLSEEGVSEYLNEYATTVSEGAIAVDFASDLERRNSTSIVPANDFDLFEAANIKKSFFPFYIQINIPTTGHTDIAKLFETGYLSTTMINAFKNTPHRLEQMYFESSGIVSKPTTPDPDEDPFSVDNATAANYGKVYLKEMNTKVYDFNSWVDNLSPVSDELILSRRGNEPFVDENGDVLEEQSAGLLEAIKNYVQQKNETLKVDYKELLTLTRPNEPGFDPVTSKTSFYCENETLMYKMEKYKYESETSRELVQTFYFPNSAFSNVIEYVDTQVKLDTLYEYEVTAYELVYGSKFVFRGIDYLNEPPYTQGDHAWFSFSVNTEAAPRIIEYPILSRKWRYAPTVTTANHTGVGGSETTKFLDPNVLVGSVSIPPISILDRPPIPPGVSILPYNRNATEVLFNFQISIGEYIGDNAIPYYGLNDEEDRTFLRISRNQKKRPLVSPSLRKGHLEFETNNSEEIRKIEIFRIKNMNVDTQDLKQLYRKFDGQIHKVLDITEFGDDVFGKAKAFDFVDNVDPNEKYYYIFRAHDGAGLMSNPSAIHTVELKEENGIFTPVIEVLSIEKPDNKSPLRRMARYIKICPSDLQKEPITQPAENGTMVQRVGIIPDTSDRVENNNFVVRLTSIDTGRKVDIRLNFKKKITTERETIIPTGNGRRQN